MAGSRPILSPFGHARVQDIFKMTNIEMAIFRKNSKKSWHIQYSAKIWYPIEVAEVKIAVSWGRWSDQGPGEEKFDKKFAIL